MEEKYAIFYYKKAGEKNYMIRVQNTKTYKYVKEIEVYAGDIDSVIKKLKSEFTPSYSCEVLY